MFSKLVELRPDLDELTAAFPELAEKFEKTVDAVAADWPTLDAERENPPLAAEGQAADSRHSAARDLAELIEQIRAQPGFATFLRPPTAAGLLSLGHDSPIVVVNVSRYRSDALIVASGELSVVPLPDLDSASVQARVLKFLAAVRSPGPAVARDLSPDGPPGSFEHRIANQREMAATLEWLWDALANPVLNALGYTGAPEVGGRWPRVSWCPTGLLSMLPIHAAGYALPADDGEPRSVMDRVVSSYTTTIHALSLSDAPRPIGTAAEESAPLVVVPHAPGAPPLPWADREAEFLAETFAGTTVLSGWSATRWAVRRALNTHRYAHFAGHAVSDLHHPLNSSLLLTDGLFSVRDICNIRLNHSEMVVLSGCGTGQPGLELADEAIHIASAFQMAGVRHVVGTLWPILDNIAGHFAELFYTSLAEGVDPAFALHTAVCELRDRYPDQPLVWAPLMHLGPSRPAAADASFPALRVVDGGQRSDGLTISRPGHSSSGAVIEA